MLEARNEAWHETVLESLKRSEVRLIAHVPDRVLAPLIAGLEADDYFRVIGACREEEAVGIVAGAWMGGVRGAVLMQTSGFATLPNAIASLLLPYQIPAILIVSERGTLGEFNAGQAMVCRTMRPVLQALAVEHHSITRRDELAFVIERSVKQAVATQSPAVLILSPLLTGRSRAGEAGS